MRREGQETKWAKSSSFLVKNRHCLKLVNEYIFLKSILLIVLEVTFRSTKNRRSLWGYDQGGKE